MDNLQFFTILGILTSGFSWLIHQMNKMNEKMTNLESRVTIIETILSMMGMPIKTNKEK